MPSATIDIVGTNPRRYAYEGGEELDEEIGAEGPSKDTRKTKIPWEKYKDRLYKLYMVEDRKLPDVMEIMKEHGLYATYQLGEKWKWKKYNQAGAEKPRKSRPPDDSNDAHEDEIVVAPTGLEVPSRDFASLRTPLLELFTDKLLDDECLGILKTSDVSQYFRLCLRWCKEEIHVDGAKFPAPYGDGTDAEPDVSVDDYECDVRIFIYLLHRYISSSALTGQDSWDTLAKQHIGPFKMLYTMSSLIVAVMGSVLKLYEEAEANSFTPPPAFSNVFHDLFSVARLGVDEIDRWEDEKLLTEFCSEFQAIIEDYTNYGNAVSSAVRQYIEIKWPGLEVHEELDFVSDEDHHDDSFGMYDQQDDFMFQVDDLSNYSAGDLR
ncbi:hypothetical protein F4680DRAFT_470121 [Xylaria scruposa]|nr:hypothetical protein F4680DRAFT_470121 [Xylaria scruposa]